ncbi:hypothetical protein [Catellatospora methionotrophica]|uniref:hypothetical protein n=1 Tax=Catellatospora methionotrophica TaxID=121620 RepID=UPI0033DBAE2A
MHVLDLIAGMVIGVLCGLLMCRRPVSRTAGDAPLTWCGNYGQPTAPLCRAHKHPG